MSIRRTRLPLPRQRSAEIGSRRRLPDATLLVGYGDDDGHGSRHSGASDVPNLTRKKRNTARNSINDGIRERSLEGPILTGL